jgi:uncharacterized membrane protein HdeD (DUF308 family)
MRSNNNHHVNREMLCNCGEYNVARITIGIGILLVVLGVAGFYHNPEAPTALIPAGFGAVLLVLGVVALTEHLRKHAMHAAVLVGLVGFVGAAVMAAKAGLSDKIDRPVAFGMQVAMAVTCAVFVGLCIKSFIDARRRRQSQAQ